MKIFSILFGCVCLLGLVAVFAMSITGCVYKDEVPTRSEFLRYKRVAIVPRLTRETEDLFLPLYMNHFPQQTVVERRDLGVAINEQDLLPGRLSAETRAKLKELFGVEAVVFPTYYSGNPNRVAIKVIDTETGTLSASVIVSGKDHWVGGGAAIDALIRRALRSLAAGGS